MTGIVLPNKVMVYGGAGQMGIVIADYMQRLGHEVYTVDKEEAGTKYGQHFQIDETSALLPQGNTGPIVEIKPDLVISALPFHENFRLASFCIDNGVAYCDLGGDLAVSKSIWGYAKAHAKAPVFTDLGLAPGLVNILASFGSAEVDDPQTVRMYCGGLPLEAQDVDNSFNYTPSWSVDGLTNEYVGNCETLESGQEKWVPALEGWCLINVGPYQLEAFNTNGGAAHTIEEMQRIGVQTCTYQTLRYQGHLSQVTKVLEEGGPDALRHELGKLGTTKKDAVLTRVEVLGGNAAPGGEGAIHWSKGYVFKYGASRSAMQIATSAGLCAVADMMVRDEGILSLSSPVKMYSNVDKDKFYEALHKLLEVKDGMYVERI